MVAVHTLSWEEVSAPDFENPARRAWREAVNEVAERAKAALPEAVNGRIEKAVAMVLNDDVEILADGKAKVAIQSNGATQYVVCNGTCECRDFARVEGGWCTHRTAAAIHKRAMTLAKQKLAQLDGTSTGQAEAPSQPEPPAQPPAPTAPLPEAPASVNVHVELAGRQVQLTMRDSDEERLLTRLDAILQRFPLVVKPTDAQAPTSEGWCRKHGVQIRQHHKDGRTWYSHRLADGSWCKGK